MMLRLFVFLITFVFACDQVSGRSLLDAVKDKVILAFGDSLTYGMYIEPDGEWRKNHPYAIRLADLLHRAGHTNSTEVIQLGISGEEAKHMVHRLPAALQKHNPKVVIILGGTNDLGMHHPTDHIIRSVTRMHEIAHRSGKSEIEPTYTVAMTLPQLTWSVDENARLEINKGIREYVKRCRHRVAFLEMENRFDQKNKSNLLYWSPDTVHFSPAGYDAIGELLFETIRDFDVGVEGSLLPQCNCTHKACKDPAG